jgi:hypothetical protein
MVISMMYYVFQVFPTTFYQCIISIQSIEGKTVKFSTHQVVIKDLKYPKHVLELELLMILLVCTNLKTLGHHIFHQFLLIIAMT